MTADTKMDDSHFMHKALELARNSLDAGEFPVGCVLVYADRTIAAAARTGTMGDISNEIDHAEIVALKHLSKVQKPFEPDKISIYTTLEPCLMCFGAILLSGIGKLVYAYEDVMGGGTRYGLTCHAPLYQNRSISIVHSILRKESLALFKAFFKNPKTAYLKESLLATYTLNQ